MKKIFSIIIVFSLMYCVAFSFSWPQKDITSESITSYFGQNRGNILSTSLVLNNTEDVLASENGQILVIIDEISDDNDFFPSSLGTCVIIEHQDKLATVYGNLDKDSINFEENKNNIVEEESIIGSIGNSGWQNQMSGLEFQILDLTDNSAINPAVLLSRSEMSLPLTLSGIVLVNKNNTYFDLSSIKSFSSGLYKVYRQRNPIATPYKTAVLVNGVQLDQITFDTLVDENSLICVNGKRKYTSTEVYPNDRLQLVGEVMLSPGKSTLELQVSDFINNTYRATWNISIY